MSYAIAGWMVLFWALQVVANIFFKWGSDGTLKWLTGFVLGHTFGMTSMATSKNTIFIGVQNYHFLFIF